MCDNDNQGIAPVSKKQGDGFNLTTNLYWGAKYGVKNYFKKYSTWKFIKSEKDISPEILERIIFSKTFSNSAKVYLIADAYRGDKMKACLTDFFSSISGKNLDSININEQQIGINSNADLIVFNGHNGLMDTDVPFYKSQDNIIRHVGVIACASHGYFEEYLLKSKGYPVIMTQQLLAPEAYNLEAIFDAWVNLHDGNYIVQQSGKAYHKYQKCGIKGATQIFRTGW